MCLLLLDVIIDHPFVRYKDILALANIVKLLCKNVKRPKKKLRVLGGYSYSFGGLHPKIPL